MMEIIHSQNWKYVFAELGHLLPARRDAGQWCIFVSGGHGNRIWSEIVESVESGRLWSYAKISTVTEKITYAECQLSGGQDSSVICVCTYDYRHKANVMKIRRVLRHIGVTQPIGYISDANISAGIAQWNYQDLIIPSSSRGILVPPMGLLQKK